MDPVAVRCACGYEHEGQCPLCACGKLVDEHLPVTYPPSPLRLFSATGPATWPPSPVAWFATHGVAVSGRIRVEHVCPGKPRTKAGNLPTLRRGTFREPPAPPEYRRHLCGFLVPVSVEPDEDDDASSEIAPRVPLRDTIALDEIAPRAMPLGMAAAALGWIVEPRYGVTGLGVEVSALVMHRDALRALASWERPEGGSWKSSGGWAWRVGERPTAVGVTRLGKLIRANLS